LLSRLTTYILKSDVGRVVRWRLMLQEFDFITQHIPGKDNVVADALSRCLVGVNVTGNSQKCHNEVVGHYGVSKTLKLLRSAGLVWKGMRADVVDFVQSCPLCQKSRATCREGDVPERHVIESFEPFEEISIDYIVNLPVDESGNKSILSVVDNFTKYVELFPVKSQTRRPLLNVYGNIKRVRSDRGSQLWGRSVRRCVGWSVANRSQRLGFVQKPMASRNA
jgi:hypothetical protein